MGAVLARMDDAQERVGDLDRIREIVDAVVGIETRRLVGRRPPVLDVLVGSEYDRDFTAIFTQPRTK